MAGSQTVRCVIIGEGPLPVRCAEMLLEQGHAPPGIVSADPAVGRWAGERGMPHRNSVDDLVALVDGQPFDYLFSIVNYTILPAATLALPRRGAINFHDGPLPGYAGRYATSWALLNGESEHAITWHLMRERADTGEILLARPIAIAPDETAFTLNAKCYEAAVETFATLIDDLAADRACPMPQATTGRGYYGRYRRPANAALIDWSQPARAIVALTRALDFGPSPNPLGLPKIAVGGEALAVGDVTALEAGVLAEPGTISAVTDDALHIAAADGVVAIRHLRTLDGRPLPIADAAAHYGLCAGARLDRLAPELAERLTALGAAAARNEDFWAGRLAHPRPATPPATASPAPPARYSSRPESVPAPLVALLSDDLAAGETPGDGLIAAFAAFLARLNGAGDGTAYDLGFAESALDEVIGSATPFFAGHLPLRLAVDEDRPFAEHLAGTRAELAALRARGTYARDLPARFPDLGKAAAAFPVGVRRVRSLSEFAPVQGSILTLVVPDHGATVAWVYDPAALDEAAIARMGGQFATFLADLAAHPDRALADLAILSAEERGRLLSEWNDTAIAYPADRTIPALIGDQAARTPDRDAIIFREERLTYRQLDARANQLARHLRGLGVGPGTLVGIFMERSLDLPVALLGVLRAGGAYVPLDVAYPAERLAYMLEDSGAPIVLTQERLLSVVPGSDATVVCLDRDWPLIARESAAAPEGGAAPDDLAYVIYTSGSTGRPKGVMVEHRNVINFFAGIDGRIGEDAPGVWLAVTSISFDISVLELCWTLARGFTVVVQAEDDRVVAPATTRPIAFSLFYFASDEGEVARDKYRLLLEGAKFADRHGFAAVWTPERHFHAFGGLYPNPSVVGAAVAAVTERVHIRAGSVVLPLHNPIRVAEEWSVVDNLSGGRVGISFATGWQSADFVLAPDNYAARREQLLPGIETVRRLWRGETVPTPGVGGAEVPVSILPRPIQPELPFWLTAAGNPETFRQAGAAGANLLTHLLGQSVEEVAGKIAIYRAARREAGHPGEGQVTLMLHTFIGEDADAVRERVRRPFSDYLKTAADLIKHAPAAFPMRFARGLDEGFTLKDLSQEDLATLTDYAFDRYFETSGLFGTPESCQPLIDRLKAIGVDEIACLIDFGVESAAVLGGLHHLGRAHALANPDGGTRRVEYSISEQITRHGVTHLQCTPSLARLLALDPVTLRSLGTLRALLLGGEALPAALAAQLHDVVSGEIHNMYGPTETTIWSTTHVLRGDEGNAVPIGRPIANTEIYLLDHRLRPVPIGQPGELYIGGDGVARGYFNRPALTAERFVPHPFAGAPGARLYKTGDLARYRPDGVLEFLGRIDHQVKIRGHRIELGEIEATLESQPDVRQATVIAREDRPGDPALVAYIVSQPGARPDIAALRDALRARLPEQMVPAAVVMLDALPLTPNGKVDRKALPAPASVAEARPYAAPEGELERTIAAVWQEVLQVEKVGVHDNIFDMGGHSILMVQASGKLRERLGRDIPLIDVFRFPTISLLARHLAGVNGAAPPRSASRVEARRNALVRRQRR